MPYTSSITDERDTDETQNSVAHIMYKLYDEQPFHHTPLTKRQPPRHNL